MSKGGSYGRANSDDPPLAGTRVLDLSWLLPGPFATMLLTELGADVVKVERPGSGDYLRELLPDLFETTNLGKRSISLDLKDPAARDSLLRLIPKFDIVVESFRPGAADRLGVGYEALRKIRADIIYVSLSGYGQDGPYALRPGHDINYLALSGALSIPSTWNEAPRRSGLPIADIAGAMYAALDMVAALRKRDLKGEGSFIDISIAESVLHWTQLRTTGHSNWHHIHPTNDVFITSDNRELSLGLVEPKFLEAFCHICDRPDIPERYPDIAQVSSDPKRARSLRSDIAAIVASRKLSDWVSRLSTTDVPFAPVNTPEEVRLDPHFRWRNAFDSDQSMRVRLPGALGRSLAGARVPELGEDTAEILSECGLG
jgi:crotonobetainyl-CoA:carnitine CoA-transferase CaiB-like acyl-CoA transferase